MAKRIKGTKIWKKTGRVERTESYGYEVYKRWYRKYSERNAMRDTMLTERQYHYIRTQAQMGGFSMGNFSRNVAMRQRESTELQIRTTWKIVKERISEIQLKDPSSRTIEEDLLLKQYGKIKLKEYRLRSKDVLSKARSTFDTREEWDDLYKMAFDSPKESFVA